MRGRCGLCPLLLRARTSGGETRKILLGTSLILFVCAAVGAQTSDTTLADFYPALHPIRSQPQRELGPIPQEGRLYQTYGGNCIFRFSNYDVWIPSHRGEFPEDSLGAPVVAKNEMGMHWDGSNYFLHPAYPYQEVTRNRYLFNIIGESPPTQWPFEKPRYGFRPSEVERREPEGAPGYPSVDLRPDHRPVSLGIAFPWPPQVSVGKPNVQIGRKPDTYVAPPERKLKLGPDGFLYYEVETPTRTGNGAP